MPTTINGIGTHYYGKQNFRSYPGRCNSCGAETMLEDYETRLWFVVLFIPLIPLGKKQILAKCPRCSRHYAPTTDQWQQVQTQTIERDLAAVSEDPNSVGGMLQLFGTLTGFKRHEEADNLAQAMLGQFGRDVNVLVEVAGWYDVTNRKVEADALFQKALAIEPQNLTLKRAVALGYIENGDPQRAKQLLDAAPAFLPRDDVSVFFQMAKAFQAQGLHDIALGVLGEILNARPRLGRDKTFRATVQASEKHLPVQGTILPRVSPFQNPWVLWPTLAAIGVAVLFGLHAWVGNHRTIHVVNGFDAPADVVIDGGAPLKVPAHARRTMKLGAGEHTVATTVNGHALPDDHFALSGAPFAALWGGTHIVNAGRGAVIYKEDIVYVEKVGFNNQGPPPHIEYFAGEPFQRLAGIDHPFEQPPREIQMKGHSETRHMCDFVQDLPIAELLTEIRDQVPAEQSLNLAEVHLIASPDDERLQGVYLALALSKQQTDRCRTFLKSHLQDRPIAMEWHRAYQHLAEIDKTEAKVQAEYDQMLAADPNNSALLYLVGRLAEDSAQAQALYAKSIAADPKNIYPRRATAYQLHVQGDLEQALSTIRECEKIAPQDKSTQSLKRHILASQKNWKAIQQDLERETTIKQSDVERIVAVRELITCYAASGQTQLAENRQDELERELRDKHLPEDSLNVVRAQFKYLQGKFAEMKRLAEQPSPPEKMAQALACANVELGNLQQAAEGFGTLQRLDDWTIQLILAIAATEKNDATQAAKYRAAAVIGMQEGSRAEARAAKLLGDPAAAKFDAARELIMDSEKKSIVLIALAQAGAPEKSQLAALADTLNIDRAFPYHLLDRAIRALNK